VDTSFSCDPSDHLQIQLIGNLDVCKSLVSPRFARLQVIIVQHRTKTARASAFGAGTKLPIC
jgi:hypothetical protein